MHTSPTHDGTYRLKLVLIPFAIVPGSDSSSQDQATA